MEVSFHCGGVLPARTRRGLSVFFDSRLSSLMDNNKHARDILLFYKVFDPDAPRQKCIEEQ
jgi:hypothetical protein